MGRWALSKDISPQDISLAMLCRAGNIQSHRAGLSRSPFKVCLEGMPMLVVIYYLLCHACHIPYNYRLLRFLSQKIHDEGVSL